VTKNRPHLISAFPTAKKIRAAFSTRNGGHSVGPYSSLNLGFFSGDKSEIVSENWRDTLEALELENHRLVLPKLTHSSNLHCLETIPQLQGDFAVSQDNFWRWAPPDCDAVATRLPGLALAVTMADCLGLLIYDETYGTIAAVHAGWRGTSEGITASTLRSLFARGWAKPESTRLCLGPCLSAGKLELGKEITAHMDARFLRQEAGREYLDMRAWNRAQAEELGVPSQQIEAVPGCSYLDAQDFFSYRRDGAQSGRMAAIIALL